MHKRPACLTNTMGGRRTLQTYIATIKHDYVLFIDSIVPLSRRENTMTTDQLHFSSSCTPQNQASQPPPLCNMNNLKHQTPLSAQHSSTGTAAPAVHPNHTNRLARKRRGLAGTHVPTTRNYTLELRTFGVITRVYPIEVQ